MLYITAHFKRLDYTSSDFVRYLYNEIRWNNRLIGIVGARGSGKTIKALAQMLYMYR